MNRKKVIAALAMAGLIAAASAFAADDAAKQVVKVSSKAVASADKKMEASAKEVDKAADGKGEQEVAERLAKKLDTTPEALIAERKQLDVSWGNLALAQMLAAKAGGSVTAEQLVQERKSGEGWGQIAAGLNLKLGQVVSEAMENGHAVTGREKASSAERGRPESRGGEAKEAPRAHGGHGRGGL